MKQKTCKGCNEAKAVTDFYAVPKMADGLMGKCKTCRARQVARLYFKQRPERIAFEKARRLDPKWKVRKAAYAKAERAKYPEKTTARYLVRRAVEYGKLTKTDCEVCGTSDLIEGHHADYSKPLEVNWLCRKHHYALHGKRFDM